jgi:hypothetical protein
VDQGRRPGRLLLTGSQDFSLIQGVTESLAGRSAVLSLPTLSLADVSPKAALAQIDAYCWRGRFPELWQRPDLERDLRMGSYLATYLERDVPNILSIGSLRRSTCSSSAVRRSSWQWSTRSPQRSNRGY